MSQELRVYIAGKVSKESIFGTEYWRDGFCAELEKLSGISLVNLDPVRPSPGEELKENDPAFMFGRDCALIRASDLVIVYLSDDISVGGSQEMLIAKYFHKPLIGIAKQGGKFRCDKTYAGATYPNWTHPFVAVPCDELVEDLPALAEALKRWVNEKPKPKTLDILEDSIRYYEGASSDLAR